MFRSLKDLRDALFGSSKTPVKNAEKNVAPPAPKRGLEAGDAADDETTLTTQDALAKFEARLKKYITDCDTLEEKVEQQMQVVESKNTDASSLPTITSREANQAKLRSIFSGLISFLKKSFLSAHTNLHDLIMKEAGPHIIKLCEQIEEEHKKLQGHVTDKEKHEAEIAICHFCLDILVELRALIGAVGDEIKFCLSEVNLGIKAAENLLNVLTIMMVQLPLSEIEEMLGVSGEAIECRFKKDYRAYFSKETEEEEVEAAFVVAEGLGKVNHALDEMNNPTEPKADSALSNNSFFAGKQAPVVTPPPAPAPSMS